MTWNPLKKKSDQQAQAGGDAKAPAAPAKSDKPAPGAKKGRPTPKMKEAQAAGVRPLVPEDRKASARAARKRLREKENLEYEAMQKGDITHMPKVERLPWRIYIRDYVDARFNIGEFFIPVAIVVLVGSMLITTVVQSAVLSVVLMLLLYVYLFASIIDVAVMWHGLKKKLIAKYGEACVGKGMRSGSYAWSRAIQLRRWRLPKPRYPKRGHWPE